MKMITGKRSKSSDELKENVLTIILNGETKQNKNI